MTLTGQQLLVGFSRFIGDYWAGETTGAGDAQTLVDAALARRGDEGWTDYYARITKAGHGALWQVRRAINFASETGSLALLPAFGAATGSGTAYELHRYDPAEKFTALDEGAIRAYPDLGTTVFDDTLTGDGVSEAFDIPATIRRGPAFVLEEDPIPAHTPWNVLGNPLGDTLDGLTADAATLSLHERAQEDHEIPKYGDRCVRVEAFQGSASSIALPVETMTISAAAAAGRRMTFASWVYCQVPGRVSIEIEDDGGVTDSTTHGGAGWELLVVEAEIDPENATTLTVHWNVSSGSLLLFWWERAWFYFGDASRVHTNYVGGVHRNVRRDDLTQRVYLDWVPLRGRQLRLIGRDTLSALGTTPEAQVTATLELDENTAQVLYAEAARVLFARESFNTVDFPEVANRVSMADRLRRELRNKWRQAGPQSRALRGPWAR